MQFASFLSFDTTAHAAYRLVVFSSIFNELASLVPENVLTPSIPLPGGTFTALPCRSQVRLSMNVILLKVGKSSTARTDQGPCPQERVASVSRSKKEVFQPHLPVRLPCYDLAPVTSFALGRSSRSRTSGAPGFHGLTGGVYKARERIHRAMADARLLANPASRSRVADSDPN